MTFHKAFIQQKKQIFEDTYIFKIKLENNYKFNFIAGQYVLIKNPEYKFNEQHPFSISSSPKQKRYLEFCIKTYGKWTIEFSKKNKGDTVYISNPQGKFVFNSTVDNAVFLLGGIGISPIMSMLRFMIDNNTHPSSITILYGNRNPNTIVYKNELKKIANILPLRIVNIFSHLPDSHPWKGYKGFITNEVIKNEVNLEKHPTFFIVGPPIFTEKMKEILSQLYIPTSHIKEELLAAISLKS